MTATFAAGDVLESRDQWYEPGRRITLTKRCQPPSTSGRWWAETTANPRRPERVGIQTIISETTLRTKWRRIDGTS